MNILFEIVAGWTKELDYLTLTIGGAPWNYSGWTITAVLRREDGTLVDTADLGTITPKTIADGTIKWKPVSNTFVSALKQNAHTLHFEATKDSDPTEKAYFPEKGAYTILVHRR